MVTDLAIDELHAVIVIIQSDCHYSGDSHVELSSRLAQRRCERLIKVPKRSSIALATTTLANSFWTAKFTIYYKWYKITGRQKSEPRVILSTIDKN